MAILEDHWLGTIPVGEDDWISYLDATGSDRSSLETLQDRVDLYPKALAAQPGSLKLWMSFCEYFWQLHTDFCKPDAPWPVDEIQVGRELYSLDAALQLWQQGYDATKYRLNDSHALWNRWISLEMEQLARVRTPEGVKRITQLFRNRLVTPHATWDDTSSMFSTFLSQYNDAAYEDTMKDVNARAKDAKKLYDPRDSFEMKLQKAERSEDADGQKQIMAEYLEWEMLQTRKEKDQPSLLLEICLGLFSRALNGICAKDEATWVEYVTFLSNLYSTHITRYPEIAPVLPSLLDALQRSLRHCPWSAALWPRYVLSAEEAGLSFHEIAEIKHAATRFGQLDRDGMAPVLDLYVAWCGYLKRTAMDPNATEEAIDLAEMGLRAGIEDVKELGLKLYKDEYKGDPGFRLERILIQYLTEKEHNFDEARRVWNTLAQQDLYASNYDFWIHYYMWEMMIFSARGSERSPTPQQGQRVPTVPNMATQVLLRAVNTKTLDWPEKIIEIYLQHCNDYERPDTVRRAIDTAYRVKKALAKRREKEYAAQVEYAAQAAQQQQKAVEDVEQEVSPSGSKRKREASPAGLGEKENTNKRAKNAVVDGVAGPAPQLSAQAQQQQQLKRDREHTSILVTNLPPDTTQTKVRQYFRDYGKINNLSMRQEHDKQSTIALIEFASVEEASSALLRDQKYMGQHQLTVQPGTDLTLYVCNFPPQADDSYIRDIFKECGEILSIRWPSLKGNTRRRFCYLSFRDQDAAVKATALDGKLLGGKYKLLAKYSDPSNKKSREGALAEGREVHVANLDLMFTEDDVRPLFAKYGEVESVKILRNMAGRSKGNAFVVFAKKEQAENAASELNNTKFGARIMTVVMSKDSNFKPVVKSTTSPRASPAPSSRDDEGDEAMADGSVTGDHASPAPEGGPARSAKDSRKRTIAVLGIPDTVNDARVRAFIEPHGEIVKLILHPQYGGALVEFADEATAGRASLGLDGAELVEGRKLRTGQVADLWREKGEVRTDRIQVGTTMPKSKVAKDAKPKTGLTLMQPPRQTRRPVLGSKGGMKRGGLGFNATTAKGSDSADTNGNGSAESAPQKNNADFRAMFVKSGEKKGDD